MNRKQLTALALLAAALSAGCTKTEDTPKPVDDSAAGRAAAVAASAVSSSKSDTEKANADLARIREIKEAEEARNKTANKSTEDFAAGMRKGAAAPVREFKTK
jgi:predicted outer membrane protein